MDALKQLILSAETGECACGAGMGGSAFLLELMVGVRLSLLRHPSFLTFPSISFTMITHAVPLKHPSYLPNHRAGTGAIRAAISNAPLRPRHAAFTSLIQLCGKSGQPDKVKCPAWLLHLITAFLAIGQAGVSIYRASNVLGLWCAHELTSTWTAFEVHLKQRMVVAALPCCAVLCCRPWRSLLLCVRWQAFSPTPIATQP
jgi:hypothetical protein